MESAKEMNMKQKKKRMMKIIVTIDLLNFIDRFFK